MRLRKLLEGIYKKDIEESFKDLEISSVCCDSRQVKEGSLFVALDGEKFKGSDFIVQAIENGAKVIAVCCTEEMKNDRQDICYLFVEHPKEFLKNITLKFYDHPSRHVRVIGITGTNGKTTTTYLIESIFKILSEPCGVVGTINSRIGKKEFPTNNTTPGFLDNQKFLADLRAHHVLYCVMEVSSHGLEQGRVAEIDFRQAIFTNLTNDHLDYHGTMDNYFEAKAKLFRDLLPKATAIINNDDLYARKLIERLPTKVLTYAIDVPADIRAGKIHSDVSRTTFELYTPHGSILVSTALIGKHNIYNILAAASSGFVEGVSLQGLKKGIEALDLVPGRLEPVSCGQKFPVLIDYAHTPDALENVLKTLRQFKNKKIILVFGCGGDRDNKKRPMMGKIASQLADFSIVTTDNPRSEDPQDIIQQIVKGFEHKNYEVVVDRTEAIHRALKMAKDDNVVLIAGKGHETYQVFKDKKIDYDERKVIKDFFDA